MKELEQDYSIESLCAAFGVSRSGYYAWKARPPSARALSDVALGQRLCVMHQSAHGCYGSPRLRAQLLQEGVRISRRRVCRLMRQHHLLSRAPRAFVPRTTDSHHAGPIAPNLMAEVAKVDGPNQVWVSDITYVPTQEGWLFVAAVMDRWSRRIVGLTMAAHMETRLVEGALAQAIHERRPPPGCLLHSDRGSQYASQAYRERLAQTGLVPSMSRSGNCYDNAAMESFWGKLKNERIHRRRFASRHEARLAIFDYVHAFYNRKRLHSALGYQSPVDFENQNN